MCEVVCEDESSNHPAMAHFLYKWQKCLDKSGIVGTLLMDLSTA